MIQTRFDSLATTTSIRTETTTRETHHSADASQHNSIGNEEPTTELDTNVRNRVDQCPDPLELELDEDIDAPLDETTAMTLAEEYKLLHDSFEETLLLVFLPNVKCTKSSRLKCLTRVEHYARQRNLPMPPALSRQQIEMLASNPAATAKHLRRVRRSWPSWANTPLHMDANDTDDSEDDDDDEDA